MKVYFSAAIYAKDKLGKNFDKIVAVLESLDHKVLQDTTVVSLNEAVNKSDEQRVKYYKKVLSWMAEADLVVLEVSFPSTLHIGHELSLAMEKGKPVLALYEKGKEPSFFLGLEHEKVMWVEYDLESLADHIEDSIELSMSKMDTRFTMLMQPDISSHLDLVARNGKSRSKYIRELIRKDMSK